MEKNDLDPSKLLVSYRRLVLWFGAQLLLSAAYFTLRALGGGWPRLDEALGAVNLVGLATLVALMVYSYRTARALGSRLGALWAIAMVVPLFNAIALLVLNARAKKACRALGIGVGWLGPRLAASAISGDSGSAPA